MWVCVCARANFFPPAQSCGVDPGFYNTHHRPPRCKQTTRNETYDLFTTIVLQSCLYPLEIVLLSKHSPFPPTRRLRIQRSHSHIHASYSASFPVANRPSFRKRPLNDRQRATRPCSLKRLRCRISSGLPPRPSACSIQPAIFCTPKKNNPDDTSSTTSTPTKPYPACLCAKFSICACSTSLPYLKASRESLSPSKSSRPLHTCA